MNFGQIVSLFVTVSENVTDWFTRIFNATGAVPFYIACFMVALSIRFLLKPITGSSDMAGNAMLDARLKEKKAASDEAKKAAKAAKANKAKSGKG